MDRHYLNCFKLYLLIPPLSEGMQVTRRKGIIPTRRPGGQDLFRMNSCVSYFAQDTPSHLNGDGIDELSDPTDFTEDMGNTKSAVKLHTFLLQAIHTPNQKNSKIFRAAAHAIRAHKAKTAVEFSEQSSPLPSPSPLPLHHGCRDQRVPPSPPSTIFAPQSTN